MPETHGLYDKITTTVTLNIWSLFKRSGKNKLAIEYDVYNKEDNYLLNLIYATRHLGLYPKIYLKMPFFEYLVYAFANRKFKKTFGYCWIKRNKYFVEKKKLLEDARIAYGIENEKIYEEIYDEFFGKDEQENV
jgi:hypothetical protein